MQTFPDNAPAGFASNYLYQDSELLATAIKNLRTGRYGSFAASIGDAANVADNANIQRIIKAFPELFWIASEL
jgi:hypothetical protein